MKKLLTYGGLVSVIWVILAVLRYEFLADLSALFYEWLLHKNRFRFWDVTSLDHFISLMLFISVPLLLAVYRKAFNTKIKGLGLFVLITGLVFLFAPIITESHPDFYKNVGVTKLLPPFSSVLQIQHEEFNAVERDLFSKKNQVIPKQFESNLVFADSIRYASRDLIYYQKGQSYIFSDYVTKSVMVSDRTFLLGTDELGRDTFTRLVYGARISLFVGFGAVLFSFIIGSLLGFAAGYSGRWIDSSLNRITEMFLTVPAIFFVIMLLAFLGNNIFTVIIVLGLSGWMSLFKIIRGEVYNIRSKDFFITAKMIGLKKRDLFFKELLPVIIMPVTANLVMLFGSVVMAESALSFLGLGTGGAYPSWGSMIDQGRNYIDRAWWLIVFPGMALFALIFNVNSAGRKLNSIISKTQND